MIGFLLVVHLMIAVAMVATVLLQRSEGGALGIGGGSGGFMTGRGAGDVLTRTTAVLALGFFLTSILLTLAARHSGSGSIVEDSGSILEDQVQTDSVLPESFSLPVGEEKPGDALELPSAPSSE